MQFLHDIDPLYQRWQRETREEGRQEGRQEALRQSLLTMFRARFEQEPKFLLTALEAAGTDTLERWIPLFATGTSDEILRELRDGQ